MTTRISLNSKAELDSFLNYASAAYDEADEAEKAYLEADHRRVQLENLIEQTGAIKLLDRDADGNPVINGKNEETRKAQLRVTLDPLYQDLARQKETVTATKVRFNKAKRTVDFFRLVVDATAAANHSRSGEDF